MTHSLPPKSLVLYADDDRDDIDLVMDAFRDHAQNVEVLTFSDGIQLMEYVEHLDPLQPLPCLFILDINMPRLNGKETLRRLRTMESFVNVPAVIFSTSTMPADENFAKSFNAGFITKPLRTEQIFHIIDAFIDHCSEDVRKTLRG